MTWKIGVSSGSVPKLDVSEIMTLLINIQSNVVDLRSGKNHKWEKDNIPPFLMNGVEIAFIGISTVLGDKNWNEKTITSHTEVYKNIPLKVFASKDCTKHFNIIKEQITSLAQSTGKKENILIETHHGFCDVEELLKLHDLFGVKVVLDTMGLAKISIDPLEDVKRLAPIIHSVQVKGFDWDNPINSMHIPLRDTEIKKTMLIFDIIAEYTSIVTLESKADSLYDDIEILKKLLN